MRFHADDSEQLRPSLPGIVPPVRAFGGLFASSEAAEGLARAVVALKSEYGFPARAEMKWSPGRGLWMRDKLKHPERGLFFRDVCREVVASGCAIEVVISEARFWGDEMDVSDRELVLAKVLTSRVWRARERPPGAEQLKFIWDEPGKNKGPVFCNTLNRYYGRLAWASVPDPSIEHHFCVESHSTVLMQVADLLVACATSYFCGESQYSPPVWQEMLPAMRRGPSHEIGGWGVTILPGRSNANHYHWMCGDEVYQGRNLPLAEHQFSRGRALNSLSG